MWEHSDSYEARLQTILRGMTKQGLGYATGAHSSFMPYHIDAITLQPKGHGWEDEMALGRTIESICRSLNNLLEHLHQSFFFYLLMHTNRFVSIGTYLPSAMLIAGNFTIMAIALWMRTGYYANSKPGSTTPKAKNEKKAETNEKINGSAVAERLMALPLTLVSGLHLLGLVPLWMFNNLHHNVSLDRHNLLHRNCIAHLVTVLHHSHLRLRRRRHHPPSTPRRLTLHRPGVIQTHRLTTIPPHQIIRPPPSRPLTLNPCNPQLLPILHDRSPLRPAQLHHPPRRPGKTGTLRRVDYWTGASQSPLPACCSLGRLLVYRCLCGDGDDSGCLWVGCMGYVDAGGCVVCVVAGLVDWVYPVGIIDVLIFCIQYFPSSDELMYHGRRLFVKEEAKKEKENQYAISNSSF